MTCADVHDQAAAFVLGALSPAEDAAVRDHLATCPEAHEEFAELGGVVPALALSVEQVEPPAALRARILAAAAADLPERGVAGRGADVVTFPTVRDAPRGRSSGRSRAPRYGWALGIAAALVIAALGAWNLRLQSQLTDAQAYQQRVDQVLAVARAPGGLMAVLRNPTGGGQDGIVAVGADGQAAMVVRGLEATSGSEVYEVWIIVGSNAPRAVGSLSQASGLAFMSGVTGPVPAGTTVALTREPHADPTAPTTPIIVEGVVGVTS